MTSPLLPPFVVVGSINVDVTAIAERLPSPGETIGGGTLRRDAGGKGANQAAAVSRLGARVRMIGAVGADADGDWMIRELEWAGVDTRGILRSDVPTGTALIAVDRLGENQIVVCPGANATVSLADVQLAGDETVLAQLELDLETVLALARLHTGYLVVNAAPAQTLPGTLVDRVDLFIVNETEYELMPELSAAARVAVTYGGDGAALIERGVEVARVPARTVRAVNTVGAGDAFCAALTLALRSGSSAEDALTTACAVGAAAVGHDGSQPPFAPLADYAPLPAPARRQ